MAPASNQVAAELRWDYRGRLETAGSNTHRSSYRYAGGIERALEDHDGSVTYYVGPNFELRDGIAVIYARVGDRRVARWTHSTLQTRLLADLAHEQGAERIGVGDAWLANDGHDRTRYLYASARRLLLLPGLEEVTLHHDHLGSITLATGLNTKVLGKCAPHVNGEVRACRGHVDAYGFTGQRRDPTTDMVHFEHRELDPRADRWMSPDPLFTRDSEACLARPFECANGYQYVSNNPVDFVDPTGQSKETGRRQSRRFQLPAIDELTEFDPKAPAVQESRPPRGLALQRTKGFRLGDLEALLEESAQEPAPPLPGAPPPLPGAPPPQGHPSPAPLPSLDDLPSFSMRPWLSARGRSEPDGFSLTRQEPKAPFMPPFPLSVLAPSRPGVEAPGPPAARPQRRPQPAPSLLRELSPAEREEGSDDEQ
ncbi:MAG: RHS repeat-associated core domain-containing protein [Myxococcales bacterium]